MARRHRRTDERGRGDYCRSPGAGPTLLAGAHYRSGARPVSRPAGARREPPWRGPHRAASSGPQGAPMGSGALDPVGRRPRRRTHIRDAVAAITSFRRDVDAVSRVRRTVDRRHRGSRRQTAARAAEAARRGSPAPGGWRAAETQTAPATAARRPACQFRTFMRCGRAVSHRLG